MRTLYLLILIISLSSTLIIPLSHQIEIDLLPPTIQVVLLIHPYNKVKVIPFSLGGIESQIYPKDRINVYLHTEKIANIDSEDNKEDKESDEWEEKKRNNELTIEMLKKWVKANRNVYNDVELMLTSQYINEDGKYWTYDRFKHLIDLKQEALVMSRKKWADFGAFIDADVVLTNENVFSQVVSRVAMNVTAIAPMLYSLGTYSNFWAGMSESGYYTRTDDYFPILDREKIGVFAVPMIHSCVFINMRQISSAKLTFDSKQLSSPLNIPYDDIIAFAKSAMINNMSLYIDNTHIWGFIPPPIEDNLSALSLQEDILDLELEALVDGPVFPVAHSLSSYVSHPDKDKLNVGNVYLINLHRRPDRKKRMLESFNLMGVEAQLWHATDGKELDEQIIEKKGIKILEGYLDPYHKRPMTYGEIGCFLSHFRIWQDMARRNISSAIVLEDDVRFERRFKSKWNQVLSSLHTQEYDFVYLGRKRQGDSTDETQIGVHFVKPSYSYWTIGYLITLQGVYKLLDANPLEKLLPVDEFLPIMYDQHPVQEWVKHYPNRNLNALSVNPLLIYPTHYVGDSLYISDTEESQHINSVIDNDHDHDNDNHKQTHHPKHTEF